MKYEAKGAYTIKSPQQLGVDGNDGPREAEGLEGACWGVCGLCIWIVEQGDERDALVALLVCHCEFWLTNVWNGVIRVLPRVGITVVCFCVLDITTVESPHRTHLTCPSHFRHSIAT